MIRILQLWGITNYENLENYEIDYEILFFQFRIGYSIHDWWLESGLEIGQLFINVEVIWHDVISTLTISYISL